MNTIIHSTPVVCLCRKLLSVVAQVISDFVSHTRIFLAGSIPDGVIEISHWHTPSLYTMALGSTQPLTEMSTRNNSWGIKAAGGYGWQPCHIRMPIVWKSGNLSLLEPSGIFQACRGITLPYTFILILFLLLLRKRIFFTTANCSVVLLVNKNNYLVFTT